MRSLWRSSYRKQSNRYIKKHFGTSQGISTLFPYMEADFRWSGKGKGDVFDPRTARKDNHEYHGLERHARQYHVTAQYLESAEHWLIAALWRREMMDAHGLHDTGHIQAVEFAINNYRYNLALHRWQRRRSSRLPPAPEAFGMHSSMMQTKEEMYPSGSGRLVG